MRPDHVMVSDASAVCSSAANVVEGEMMPNKAIVLVAHKNVLSVLRIVFPFNCHIFDGRTIAMVESEFKVHL